MKDKSCSVVLILGKSAVFVRLITFLMVESDTHSEIETFSPDVLSAVPIFRGRRQSFLDIGGVSSINNFASSVERSVNFLSTSLDSSHTGVERRRNIDDLTAIDDEDVISRLLENNNQNIINYNETGYGSINNPNVLINNGGNNNNNSISNINNNTNNNIINNNIDNGSIYRQKSNISYSVPTSDMSSIHSIKIISKKSTPMQTTFNSINVLIGLGILSIPLALHLSGWIFGIIFLILSAYTTNKTAILIGRIFSKYPQLQTYQDLGVYFLGKKMGNFISLLFIFDLVGAGLSMVLLFADSFNSIFPELNKIYLKIFICSLLIILNFLPLRILSFLSISGIFCTTMTCLMIAISGFYKFDKPGSLINFMPTNLWPTSLINLLFSLGLFLAPWGGHATFPEIYRDQLIPEDFNKCMNKSFSFSFSIDLATGILGFLMFGSDVKDEITGNILENDKYPIIIRYMLILLMGFLPISKLPLVSKPILTMMDNSCDKHLLNRILLSLIMCLISIAVVEFGSVLSLLGSGICFAICIVVPSLCYGGKIWTTVGLIGILLGLLGVIGVIFK